MTRMRIAPIVEGDGEVAAVPVLLRRVWSAMDPGGHVDVLRPIRKPRDRLLRQADLDSAIQLAASKLSERRESGTSELVLVLVDAHDDPACALGPRLLDSARLARPDLDVACVVAQVEYETWFVASAPTLGRYLALGAGEDLPEAPEAARLGKGWIQKRIRKPKYSETVDQPALTASIDVALCRGRSPSFDKLCRELERRLGR